MVAAVWETESDGTAQDQERNNRGNRNTHTHIQREGEKEAVVRGMDLVRKHEERARKDNRYRRMGGARQAVN